MREPQKIIGPNPKKGTRYRIQGPRTVSGMTVWNVVDLRTRESIGPPWTCFSLDEARQRVEDAIKGKKVIWFGNTRLTRRRVR